MTKEILITILLSTEIYLFVYIVKKWFLKKGEDNDR